MKKSDLDRGASAVVDANLNRAREGLRVLEDTARFVWRAPALFAALRGARHGLDRATRSAYGPLVGSRSSETDMGRRMAEPQRRKWEGLAAANFRRVQEALRVLEEYAKVFSPGGARSFKKIRFEMYIVEKKSLIHCLPSPPASGRMSLRRTLSRKRERGKARESPDLIR